MRFVIHRLRSLAFASAVLSCQAASFSQQAPPDPTSEEPRNTWVLAEDPFWTCVPVGDMNFPKGRLRTVSWFMNSGYSSPGGPPGWEKRAVLKFDDHNRCIEVESWWIGLREYRRRLESPGTTRDERILDWAELDSGPCWVSYPVWNAAGLQIATLFAPWISDGLQPVGGDPEPKAEYEYDARGLLIRSTIGNSSDPSYRLRWECWRDEAGRVRRIRRERGREGDGSTQDFEYDSEDRVSVFTLQFNDDAAVHVSEFAYDDAGRLVEACKSVDGRLSQATQSQFDLNGRLTSRWTFEAAPVPNWPVDLGRYTEESFDGIDRPQHLRISTTGGRTIENYRWTYEDDARGNWIRKTPHDVGSEHASGPMRNEYYSILRVIEYAD